VKCGYSPLQQCGMKRREMPRPWLDRLLLACSGFLQFELGFLTWLQELPGWPISLLFVHALRWLCALGQRLLPQSGQTTKRMSATVIGLHVVHQQSRCAIAVRNSFIRSTNSIASTSDLPPCQYASHALIVCCTTSRSRVAVLTVNGLPGMNAVGIS